MCNGKGIAFLMGVNNIMAQLSSLKTRPISTQTYARNLKSSNLWFAFISCCKNFVQIFQYDSTIYSHFLLSFSNCNSKLRLYLSMVIADAIRLFKGFSLSATNFQSNGFQCRQYRHQHGTKSTDSISMWKFIGPSINIWSHDDEKSEWMSALCWLNHYGGSRNCSLCVSIPECF